MEWEHKQAMLQSSKIWIADRNDTTTKNLSSVQKVNQEETHLKYKPCALYTAASTFIETQILIMWCIKVSNLFTACRMSNDTTLLFFSQNSEYLKFIP